MSDLVMQLREAQAALARVAALADSAMDFDEIGEGWVSVSALSTALGPRQTRASAPRSDEQAEVVPGVTRGAESGSGGISDLTGTYSDMGFGLQDFLEDR